MSRAFCIPGILFLFCAFVLSFIVSVSLPYLPALDIVRTNFGDGIQQGAQGVVQTRLGIWAPCAYDTNGSRTCLKAHRAYTFEVTNVDKTKTAKVKASWTRGLAVHPVATAAIFVALLLSLSTHVTVTLFASLVSFLAATLTLIAFAIDIALYVLVRHAMNKLEIGANTNTAPGPDPSGPQRPNFRLMEGTLSSPVEKSRIPQRPPFDVVLPLEGFWITLVILILTLLAGCTVCFGRRRDRMVKATNTYPMEPAKPSKPGFFAKFRRSINAQH